MDPLVEVEGLRVVGGDDESQSGDLDIAIRVSSSLWRLDGFKA